MFFLNTWGGVRKDQVPLGKQVEDLRFGAGDCPRRWLEEVGRFDLTSASSVDVSLAMNEAYNTAYGIIEAKDQSAPLSTSMMHKSENLTVRDPRYEFIKTYRDKQIYSKFGISLTEMLRFPGFINDYIFELATDATASEISKLNDILKK